MVLLDPLNDLLVRAVAEGSVGRAFAVAQLVVARLTHVEGHGSAASENPLALAVAERINLGVPAAAPVVLLASVQVNVCRENTSVRGHAWRSVPAFLIGPRLRQFNLNLFGEIGNIVHRLDFSLRC